MQAPSELTNPADLKSAAGSEMPLIDQRVMSDWCSDMDKADVLAILSRIPGECAKSVGEFERAIAASDLALARRSAHRLKGMANNLGAARLAQMARAIELGSQSIDDVAHRLPALRKTLSETLAALPVA